MIRTFFSLSFQATLRRKRTSALILATLTLTFAFALVTLSMNESIGKTNEAYRYSAFGEWYLAILEGTDEDEAWIAQQDWTEEFGHVRVYGIVRPLHAGTERSFGTADEAFLRMGHVTLLQGRMPQTSNEAVLSETMLRELGYDDVRVGQVITLPLRMHSAAGQEICELTFTFTLCGVMKDYSSLWSFTSQGGDASAAVGTTRPPDVLMTQEAAQSWQKSMESEVSRIGRTVDVIEQYYVCVRSNSRQEAARQAAEHLKATRRGTSKPCVNLAAYPATEAAAAPSTLYACLIAAVALVAVLCVYLMSLSTEVHRFSVLRSIGITKGQLLALMGLESLLLVAPAMLLGLPLGVLLTKLALRILVYSDSVPVRSSVPYDALLILLLLWLLVIVLARLIVFAVTVRTPLTGRMQLRRGKARRAMLLRRALIALLLVLLGASVAYTTAESRGNSSLKRYWESRADYTFLSPVNLQTGERSPILPSTVARLDALPGVECAEGYMEISASARSGMTIEFDGIEERRIDFFMVDEEMWADTLNLGKDAEAFRRGELVLLCFKEKYLDANRQAYEWDGPMPAGDVTLRAYEKGECVAQLTATPKLWRVALSTQSRVLSFYTPYSVVCSEAYLKKLLDTMLPGTTWGVYTAGEEFGYQRVWLTTDSNASALSIDQSLRTVIRQEGLETPDSYREENQLYRQSTTQSLLLLYACGGCIALVALLLLGGALTLEAEQEKRHFAILRVIGMSGRQMRRRVVGKALLRSAAAVAAGWALYTGFLVYARPAFREYGLGKAVSAAWREVSNGGAQIPFLAALSAAVLTVLLIVSLLAKRGLRNTALPKS